MKSEELLIHSLIDHSHKHLDESIQRASEKISVAGTMRLSFSSNESRVDFSSIYPPFRWIVVA